MAACSVAAKVAVLVAGWVVLKADQKADYWAAEMAGYWVALKVD